MSAIIIFVALMIFLIVYESSKPREEDPINSPTEDERLRMEEYRFLNSEIERRERSMIMMGSIFLPASFIILAYSVLYQIDFKSRLFLIIVPLSLYTIWLFAVQLTTWWLNEITYARLHGIESQNHFEVHNYMRNRIRCNPRIIIRRHHWVIFMIALYVFAALSLVIL